MSLETNLCKINLKKEYGHLKCDLIENQYTTKCNDFSLKKELIERNCTDHVNNTDNTDNTDKLPYLYPSLNDPNFNIKIATKKEFAETQYDGTIYKDIKKHADELSRAEFELQPHQTFVRNFVSHQTPYNSLLLYHGLGTGKTLSAIGVCEEMREIMITQNVVIPMIIVASSNVQDNFRSQLFNERQLTEINGLWVMRGAGSGNANKLLKEINPTNIPGIPKDKIMAQVHQIIDRYYKFMGYGQFANFISKIVERESIEHNAIQRQFKNRLIVIDEIHNIKNSDKVANKKIAAFLELLVRMLIEPMKLLFLSATPMYNSYDEIIWLLNIMNMNDKRALITHSQLFTNQGDFKEGGKELLMLKATGYVSYVRGENPYTFPFRVYPNIFSPNQTFAKITYPSQQMNGHILEKNNRNPIINLFLTEMGIEQAKSYTYVMDIFNQDPTYQDKENFGYSELRLPMQLSIMSYPITKIENKVKIEIDPSSLSGTQGLRRMMNFRDIDKSMMPEKGSFEYKKETLTDYGRIFHYDNIGLYSSKIKTILEQLQNNVKGIILIYSEYIDAGLIPMALALEEMGLTRYGNKSKNLFKRRPISVGTKGNGLHYSMITGDQRLSPDNDFEVHGLTEENNVNGENIKVVLISRAGAEGIDFKYIRQVHILEPWYNLNRIEQIIGRGVRNQSHKLLPFEERNVEIFLHVSLLSFNSKNETADLHVYRIAEAKAIQIGKITRLLKETAVDCILNYEQTNFTRENMIEKTYPINQILASGQLIENFPVGDAPFTSACDYMNTCNFSCTPSLENIKIGTNEATNTEFYIYQNIERIGKKIRLLMQMQFFYKKNDLIHHIQIPTTFSLAQIYATLTEFIEDDTLFIEDKYGREGHLVNIGDYYLFQPLELTDNTSSLFERSIPIDYKNNVIQIQTKPISYIDVNNNATILQNITNLNNIPIFIQIMELNWRIAMNDISNDNGKIDTEEITWYHTFYIAYFIFLQKIPEATLYITDFLIAHIIEQLQYTEKRYLIDFIYSNKITDITATTTANFTNFISYVKLYFERIIYITKQGTKSLLLVNTELIPSQDSFIFLIWINNSHKWIEATPIEREEIEEDTQIIKELTLKRNDMTDYIGFMVYVKKIDTFVFKVIQPLKSRNNGFRCDEAGKKKIMDILNELLNNNEAFTKNNTKQIKENNVVIQEQMGVPELCIIQELIFRYYHQIRQNGKKWFLLPEIAIYIGIYKIF